MLKDIDIKVLTILVGTTSAIFSIITNVVLFFWNENRKQYQSRISALRMLLIIIEYISVSTKAYTSGSNEIKLDWLISNSDSLCYSKESLSCLKRIVKINAEFGKIINSSQKDNKTPDFSSLASPIKNVQDEIDTLIQKESKNPLRIFYMIPTKIRNLSARKIVR